MILPCFIVSSFVIFDCLLSEAFSFLKEKQGVCLEKMGDGRWAGAWGGRKGQDILYETRIYFQFSFLKGMVHLHKTMEN